MNMKRHILDVHVNKNIKPFKCTMCSFASHAKRYLLWHVRRHHNPNNPPGGDPKGTVMDFIHYRAVVAFWYHNLKVPGLNPGISSNFPF